ncbi:MAG: tripartite tricarboxylate transporter TctB family protein [Burkholderiaceae bacterium]
MNPRDHQDFFAGLMFIIIGAAFGSAAGNYDMGTASRMGPGYFPVVLSGLLVVLGLVILVGAFRKGAPHLSVEPIVWRPLVTVLGAIALFAFALPKLGFVLSMIVLIVVSSLAAHDSRLRDTMISCLVLLVFSWVVFVQLLEVQFPTWPTFLGG